MNFKFVLSWTLECPLLGIILLILLNSNKFNWEDRKTENFSSKTLVGSDTFWTVLNFSFDDINGRIS